MSFSKKTLLAGLVLFGGATALSAWQYGTPSTTPPFGSSRGTTAPEAKKKPPQFRALTGTVLDQADNAVPHAIVYLKNLKTLAVKTYIAGNEGVYQFNGLSPNIDYEFYAELNGHKSSAKTFSAFDSRPKATINIHLDLKQADQPKKQDKEQSKQEETK